MALLEAIEHWIGERVAQWTLPKSTEYAIRLCCEESFTNIVRHGLTQGDPEAKVVLELSLQGRWVCLTLVDPGKAFDPLEQAEPSKVQRLEDAQIGGLGIVLMRKFTRSMRYERRGNENILSMVFDLPDPSPRAHESQELAA
jgi:serine/threonine-protein kinase RsbW